MKKIRDIKDIKFIKRLSNLLKKINVGVTILLVLTTLISYSATIVNPVDFAIPSYLGIGFPYILIVDVLYTTLLILTKKLTSLAMLAVLIFGYKNINTTIQVNPLHYVEDFSEDDSSFSLMSFNVRLLDRYNWIKSKNDIREKIFEFLKYESPEIICFQEFYNNYGDSITNEDIIKNLLKTEYCERDYNPEDTIHKTNKGYRIFSKYKLENKQPIFDMTDNLIGIYADANVINQKIRIFNIHLKSIKLGYDDYDFIEKIDKKNNKEQISGLGNIFTKLNKAYEIRVSQALMIDSIIKQSPYPVILCGDFNEPSVSYCYQKIIGNLADAFCESGTGFGETMRVKFLNFRIDYILHSKSLISKRFRTHKENLSDHYAISCKFKIKP